MALPPLPPWPEVVDVILRIVLPAGLLTAVVPFLFVRRWGWRGVEAGLAMGAALGLALANAMRGTLPWLPGTIWGWPWLVWVWGVALTVGAWSAVRLPFDRFPAWLCAGSAAIFGAAVLLPSDYRGAPWGFIGLAAAMFLPWFGFASEVPLARASNAVLPAADPPRRTFPNWLGAWAAALIGGALVLLHAHSARMMDVGLLTGFALGGGAVSAWWLRVEGRSLAPLVWVTLPGLMLIGANETSSRVPTASFALIGLAAFPTLAFRYIPAATFIHRSLRWALVLVPVVIAVILALRAETLDFN